MRSCKNCRYYEKLLCRSESDDGFEVSQFGLCILEGTKKNCKVVTACCDGCADYEEDDGNGE